MISRLTIGIYIFIIILIIFSSSNSTICDVNFRSKHESVNISKPFVDVIVIRFRGTGRISIKHSSNLNKNLIVANAKWKFQFQYEISSNYLRVIDNSIYHYGRTHLQVEVGYILRSWNWSIDIATIFLLIIFLGCVVICICLKLKEKFNCKFQRLQSVKGMYIQSKRKKKLKIYRPSQSKNETELFNEEITEMINFNNTSDQTETQLNNANTVFHFEKANSFDEESTDNNPDVIDSNSVNELIYKLQLTQRQQLYRVMRTIFVLFCSILIISIFLFVIYLSTNEHRNFDNSCYIQSLELIIPRSFEAGIIEIYHSNKKDLRHDHEDNEFQSNEKNLQVFNYLLPYLKAIPINIFSIDDAAASGYPMCDANEICQTAWRQGRLGCDPVSQKCLCTRGFQLYNGACIDINECLNENTERLCGLKNKICMNTIGSYKCVCDKTFSDGINCQTCDRCPEFQFDYNQCLDSKSTFCIDIRNPLLPDKSDDHLKEDRKSYKLISSENVFSEDLLQLESLNISIGVSSNKQNSSFIFNRKSGLVVRINLNNISMNPMFEDVTHSGDNSIILKSSQGSSTYHLKNPLMNVLRNHCRFPLPKYYYITMNEYRHRYTTAVKIICANQKYPGSKEFCPADFFDGQIYYFRTLNNRCSSNKASLLPFERNGFYCTQNSEFVNNIFNHQIDEKISVSQKSICDVYYKKCKTCLRSSVKVCQNSSKKSKSCCETKCYRNLSCMAFYTSKCYDGKLDKSLHAENICLKGDTLKFTLLPKFDFENESFLCHLKKIDDSKPRMRISFNLHIIDNDKPLWTSKPIVQEIMLDKFSGHKFIDFISLNWTNFIDSEKEMYLKGFQEHGTKSISYRLYKMKKKKDFTKGPMKVYKHQNSKYLQFQNWQPFYFNSENWYNFSCRLSTKNFYPIQDLYLPDYQRVKVLSKNHDSKGESKSAFKYTIDSFHNPSQVKVELLNKSIIRSFVCSEKSGKLIIPTGNFDSHFLQLISVRWPTVWKIYFEGTVSDIPTFINVKIIDITSQSVLFHQDQIIHKSYYDTNQFFISENFQEKPFYFINNFHFEKKLFSSYETKNFAFQIEINDCFKNHKFKLYYFTKINLQLTHLNNSQIGNYQFTMGFINIANKITSITLSMGLIYLLIIIFYIFCSIWRKIKNKDNLWESIKPKLQNNKSNYTNISYKKKVFMLLYVAFRVFYTFLFTLSVSLSLLLGLDSYSNEFYGNQQRIFNWINQETKQINQLSTSEFKRQLQYSNNMKKACESHDISKINKLEREIISSLNGSIKHWYSIDSGSIINQSIDFSQQAITRYESRIDKISDKLQFNVKHRFLDRYGQYQELIKQFYFLQYFNVIQKVHNKSQQYSTQQTNNYPNTDKPFVENSMMQFLNFIEIYETKSLNFYPFQNLKNLQIQFERFYINQKRWKTKFQMKPFKYKSKKKWKIFHRMFDAKSINYHQNSFVFDSAEKLPNSKKINIRSLTSFKILKARIFLMVIDCFIVIYRFYNTFEILKWIFLGRKMYVFNSVPKEIDKKIPTENVKRNQDDKIKFPTQSHYGLLPFSELSLRIISQNRFPDWSIINQNPSGYSSCFKSRKYFQSFGQMHFIAVTIVFVLLVALLTFVVVTNYWYIKHYNPDVYKQNLEVLQKSQWLINLLSRKFSDYINNYALTNSKIHNMNMSSLIINSSYHLSHNQKNVCQQLNWEIKSIRARSNTHSTLSFDICRSQSDVNFLPHLLMHISPCQFLSVLPINYSASAIISEKTNYKSDSINKINQLIFIFVLLIITVSTFIGSVQIMGNVLIKSVLGSNDNSRYFFLTSTYPHANSVKIHSSSSHSSKGMRNHPICDSSSLLKRPLPTVTSGQFNDFSTSLHFFQLTATSESDV